MLDQLPDVALIALFSHLPYGERLRMELVCHRFRDLMAEVWNRKEALVFPYDVRQINNNKYPLSSYLADFGPEMKILINHCPNLRELRFENFRRLMVFMQTSSMTYFARYPTSILDIREIFVGSKYVTDIDVIRAMARGFPNLEVLTVLHPYPLIHQAKYDTMQVLRSRIPNLEPQVLDLMEDNEKVVEDIRLYLEIFPRLRVLKLKDANFDVKELAV